MTTGSAAFAAGSPARPRASRRSVELKGYIVRANDEIVDLRVIDLSYDGCGIETTAELHPGEEVKLSVLGSGSHRATVQWFENRKAGLLFVTDPCPNRQKSRVSDRIPVTMEALLRRAGSAAYRTQVSDISPKGCKCEFIHRPMIDEAVWIKFDGLEPLEARVSWIEGANTGLQFARQIHPSVLNMLMARSASV